jgi:ubiquitin C-terminal hydrolase
MPERAKLFNIHDINNSIEETVLLIDKVHKSGGINAAIKKLSQPTDEEERRIERVDDGNKSCSKEDKMEEQ